MRRNTVTINIVLCPCTLSGLEDKKVPLFSKMILVGLYVLLSFDVKN